MHVGRTKCTGYFGHRLPVPGATIGEYGGGPVLRHVVVIDQTNDRRNVRALRIYDGSFIILSLLYINISIYRMRVDYE